MALTIFRYPFEVDCHPRRHHRMRRTQSETEDEYTFNLVMPGVNRDAVKVEVVRRKLKISLTKVEVVRRKLKISLTKDGASEAQWISLPKYADRSGITAKAKNGVLAITIKKKTRDPTKKIDLRDSIELIDSAYKLDYSVPGAGVDDVQVSITGARLTINAQSGSMDFFDDFRRTLSTPSDADLANVSAALKDGLLLIQIPKLEPVTVPVEKGQATESDELYVAYFRTPGIPAEKIEVTRVGRKVEVEAKLSDSMKENDFYSSVETEFSESIYLPESVDLESTRAVAENGVLAITAPVLETERPREVAVQSES
mmetsp:Transcript_28667/g.111914  ORF Transcript_28667/g.111914 Transcript_28667/m.111914 type:complete len:313 (-) Transcript_28667:908-1846(-)|eukprot:CAMPEP_0113955958 /NCGR_PEP_ID=MMETSP0011_2-20120614/1747_1 /TAXON_ID=101924 /ORGANISM="Rhodosorus marinus" /LENGTH=312 /DNA_ID=CAMNT_0000965955 /DNA_START=281 /DNA_END=1219 /DNA_ORIENTATION=+ /assembly_acc=CAM_ASM_000156